VYTSHIEPIRSWIFALGVEYGGVLGKALKLTNQF
jgi:hypothetical protein